MAPICNHCQLWWALMRRDGLITRPLASVPSAHLLPPARVCACTDRKSGPLVGLFLYFNAKLYRVGHNLETKKESMEHHSFTRQVQVRLSSCKSRCCGVTFSMSSPRRSSPQMVTRTAADLTKAELYFTLPACCSNLTLLPNSKQHNSSFVHYASMQRCWVLMQNWIWCEWSLVRPLLQIIGPQEVHG